MLTVREYPNNANCTWPSVNVTSTVKVDPCTYKANLYTHLEFSINYQTARFNYADVVVTNRFTMDSTRVTIDFSKCAGTGDTKRCIL